MKRKKKPWWFRLWCGMRGHAGIEWEGAGLIGTVYRCKRCGAKGRLK